MNLKGIICKIRGKHIPYHRPHQHKWHLWCRLCGKELVAHNPEPKVAPYKVEPDPIALAKQIPEGEATKQPDLYITDGEGKAHGFNIKTQEGVKE